MLLSFNDSMTGDVLVADVAGDPHHALSLERHHVGHHTGEVAAVCRA